ncbi:hypothetical protein TRAPUB_10759 [Trametes pubescens]|uniref:Uncharacterized protein n=1 Tax=Trametes pubescens TaxID=154538 RepID=A0A1M2VYN0_TRAPU|nr:hypothetical protein TRAPUB_10759 [Trametes pubescens]
MTTSTILVKLRATLSTHNPLSPLSNISLFDVAITPNKPIRVGQQVQLLALDPCDDLFPSKTLRSCVHYTTVETGVRGVVERVRTVEEETVEFVVRNDNGASPTSHALLAVQRIQGKTVNISAWERARRALLTPRPPTLRRVPIETNTVVFMDTTTVQPRYRPIPKQQTNGGRCTGRSADRDLGERGMPQDAEEEEATNEDEAEGDEDYA